MSLEAKWECLKAIYPRYCHAGCQDKHRMLTEFCDGLSSKVRRPAAQRAGAHRHPPRTSATREGHLRPGRDRRLDGALDGGGLPLVGACQGVAAALAAVGALAPVADGRGAAPRDQPAPNRSAADGPGAALWAHQARDPPEAPHHAQDRALGGHCGRPYKKDDNFHIEQKNWTHVRKLLGYVRYDTPLALAAINDLYRPDAAHVPRTCSCPRSSSCARSASARASAGATTPPPARRSSECPGGDPATVVALTALRDRPDPFALAQTY